MAPDSATANLKEFRDFVSGQIERGGPVPTPEECVRLWREWREVNEAIREGLDQVDRGLVQPVDEFMTEFRLRNGLPPRRRG